MKFKLSRISTALLVTLSLSAYAEEPAVETDNLDQINVDINAEELL